MMKSFLLRSYKVIMLTLLTSILGVAGVSFTHAQLPYKLTVSKQFYVPLTGGTNIVSEVWFNSDLFPMPVPFSTLMDTVHCTAPFIEGGSTVITDTGKGIVSSFFLTDANLIDKGFLGSDYLFLSPIRYQVDGDPGNRIFKLEIANAAFFNEIVYTTQHDSVYMQVWLYETSNIVELRYGPSHISHAYNYFPNKGFPGIGYIQDVDSSLNGTYHILGGDPQKPFVESIPCVNGVLKTSPAGLNSFPAAGTVYRFTPGAAAIKTETGIPTVSTRVYPTSCTNELMIDYATPAPSAKASYSLYTINGILQNSNILLPNATTHVDMSTLPPGMYIVELQTSNGTSRQKVAKVQ